MTNNECFKQQMKLKNVQKCNEGLINLFLNGYISKWQYKRIDKKLTKAFKEASQVKIDVNEILGG